MADLQSLVFSLTAFTSNLWRGADHGRGPQKVLPRRMEGWRVDRGVGAQVEEWMEGRTEGWIERRNDTGKEVRKEGRLQDALTAPPSAFAAAA